MRKKQTKRLNHIIIILNLIIIITALILGAVFFVTSLQTETTRTQTPEIQTANLSKSPAFFWMDCNEVQKSNYYFKDNDTFLEVVRYDNTTIKLTYGELCGEK